MKLHKNNMEVAAYILKMLNSNQTIQSIQKELLQWTGEYLEAESAGIFRMNPESKILDTEAEWHADPLLTVCGGSEDRHPKPEALSVPFFANGEEYVLCYQAGQKERTWESWEIALAADTVAVLCNIGELKRAGDPYYNFNEFLKVVLDNIGYAVYIKDVETDELLFANRMLKSDFGKEFQEGTLDKLFENGKPVGNRSGYFEINYMESNCWFEMSYRYLKWLNDRQAVICSVRDITDKKLYQRKMEQQTYTDFLTGLYNRICCERDLAGYIDDTKIHTASGALLYLDLDDFKHINDGLGHQYGDTLLKEISERIRQIDGIQDTCYRVGGDEFIIIVSSKHYARLSGILSEIRNTFNKPWFLKDADYYCTMSMGVVKFPEDGDSVQELIKKADIAMYEAKRNGKDRIAYYKDSIGAYSNKRLDMEKNMRYATAAGYQEFEVYYQPIFDIQKENTPCVGAEALIRWNSAELGFIPPSDFIPLAEYLGLINPIGNYILEQACMACKYWNDTKYPGYKVNVNLSVVQLLQPDIVNIVEEAIKKSGLDPNNLTLEVTESLAINDMQKMKVILGGIKMLGVRIALDDFGTGYSSLNHIREIPFDVIKVDQSFVRDLAEDAYSQSFIKMIAELAGSIDVSICVEGIETREQYKVLEGMKVQLVQGYYFDMPMKRQGFEEKYL